MPTPFTVISDLAEALPVPPEGTLSRVLHHDDRVRVVGFAFAAGEELAERGSALPVIIQVIRGRLDLLIGGDGAGYTEKAEALPGCWTHLPAQVAHTVRATEPTVMLLTMLPPPADAVQDTK
jgi:quercetin dioxygenase-like cupin family protein